MFIISFDDFLQDLSCLDVVFVGSLLLLTADPKATSLLQQFPAVSYYTKSILDREQVKVSHNWFSMLKLHTEIHSFFCKKNFR